MPPSRLVDDYPPALEAICLRALSIKREDRYPTAADMRRELVAYEHAATRSESPAEALATLMQSLFSDRIAEKQDLLRKMRSGSDVTHVPVGEVDENVELRSVVAELTRASGPRAELPRKGRSLLRKALVPAALVVILGGATVYARRAPSTETAAPASSSIASASIASVPVVATSAPSAAKASNEITLHVETQPVGARVVLDDVDRGATPLDVKVARGAASLALELRRPGYLPRRETIGPDSDQRLRALASSAPGRARRRGGVDRRIARLEEMELIVPLFSKQPLS